MDKVFENNPELKVYYKTADGTAFYTEPDARMHARSLSDKSVEPVYRSVIENVAVVLEDDSQKKLQDAVQADALSGMMSEDGAKEAEEKAKQEAEEKAKQEAEEKAKQEAEEKAKQEAEVKATKKAAAPKAKKVTQTKEK